ncbi:MAG: hypothetical protein AAF725_04700 [Acidobacteriota bacterium]
MTARTIRHGGEPAAGARRALEIELPAAGPYPGASDLPTATDEEAAGTPYFRAESARLFRRCLEDQRDEDWRLLLATCGERLREAAGRILRARGLGSSPEEIEELMQEVLLRWCRSRRGFAATGENALWRFFNTSLANAVSDRVRQSCATKRRPRHGYYGLALFGVRRARDPEEHALREERRRHIARRCVQLAGRAGGDGDTGEVRRTAAALGHIVFAGCSSREACRRSGASLSPQRVDNILRSLRRQLAREGIELPHRGGRPRVAHAAPRGRGQTSRRGG